MQVRLSPQRREPIVYTFGGGSITATIGEQSETWDFTAMPDGVADEISADVLPVCPVLAARRDDGELTVTLLMPIATGGAPEAVRFPPETISVADAVALLRQAGNDAEES